MQIKSIRIVKPDIGNWSINDEMQMPENVADELVKEGSAVYIKAVTQKPKEGKTLSEVMEQHGKVVAEKN